MIILSFYWRFKDFIHIIVVDGRKFPRFPKFSEIPKLFPKLFKNPKSRDNSLKVGALLSRQ